MATAKKQLTALNLIKMNELEWLLQKDLITQNLSYLANVARNDFEAGLLTKKQYDFKLQYIISQIDFITLTESLIYELQHQNKIYRDLALKILNENKQKQLYERIGIDKGQ